MSHLVKKRYIGAIHQIQPGWVMKSGLTHPLVVHILSIRPYNHLLPKGAKLICGDAVWGDTERPALEIRNHAIPSDRRLRSGLKNLARRLTQGTAQDFRPVMFFQHDEVHFVTYTEEILADRLAGRHLEFSPYKQGEPIGGPSWEQRWEEFEHAWENVRRRI